MEMKIFQMSFRCDWRNKNWAFRANFKITHLHIKNEEKVYPHDWTGRKGWNERRCPSRTALSYHVPDVAVLSDMGFFIGQLDTSDKNAPLYGFILMEFPGRIFINSTRASE